MDDELKNKIWDVLVKEAGAPDEPQLLGNEREQFLQHFPKCREFRFIGKLGFGGKVRYQKHVSRAEPKVYVDCYQENLTPEREEIIENTNRALFEVMQGVNSDSL